MEQELQSEDYKEKVFYDSPFAKSFLKLSDEDRAGLHLKINAVTLQSLSKTFRTQKKKKKKKILDLFKNQIDSAYITSDAGAIFRDLIGKYELKNLEKR